MELIDLVRNHLEAAVGVDERHGVAAPVHRRDPFAERSLLVERNAEVRVGQPERREHLVAEVPVDGTAVDTLDDRAEDLPAARRVVRGVGPRLPARRRCRDVRDDLVVRDVAVEQLGVGVGEAARVREHVADRAALLAPTPAVDVLADPVVEAELALLPELEHGDHRHGLARRVQEHQVVALQGPSRARFAHRHVEQDLAVPGHVALRPVVPAVGPLALEEIGDGSEVGPGLGDRHGSRA